MLHGLRLLWPTDSIATSRVTDTIPETTSLIVTVLRGRPLASPFSQLQDLQRKWPTTDTTYSWWPQMYTLTTTFPSLILCMQ